MTARYPSHRPSHRPSPQPSHPQSREPAGLPRVWLMTDERASDPVAAARRLPPRSGIVLRHYATPPRERVRLTRALRRIAHARGHVLLIAETSRTARMLGGDGAHGGSHRRSANAPGVLSMSAHNRREVEAARCAGAKIVFFSPVHATRSHADAHPLGTRGFARLSARGDGLKIALGGMNAARFRRLRIHGCDGWAGIDAFGA